MCSGERSSSANGAIALRQSAARSWSISSSRVLSDWTIRGPSFTPRTTAVRRRALARPPAGGRGTPRRWRARSTGPSSSDATGSARCRRRRGARRRRADAQPGRPEVAHQRRQPEQGLADQQLRDARGPGGDVQVQVLVVVVGDPRRDRVPHHQLVEARRPRARRRPLAGLEDRAQLALEACAARMQSRSVHCACSHSRPARWSAQRVDVGELGVEQRGRLLGVPEEVHPSSLRTARCAGRGAAAQEASSGRTAVIRCTANVRSSSLRWSCAVSQPPSTRTGSTTRSELVPWLST